MWGSLPTKTSGRGLTPSLPILRAFSSISSGLAFASSCRSKSTWQRQVMLSEGTFPMWSSCGNETRHTDHLPPHKPPSMRQRALSLVHAALKTGVATIGNSCPSQCLLAWCPRLAAPIFAAKSRRAKIFEMQCHSQKCSHQPLSMRL